MHVLISSARPSRALSMNSGSARRGRAMLIRSEEPEARMSSAVSGALILGFQIVEGDQSIMLVTNI